MSKDTRYHGYVSIQSRGVLALPRELRERMHLDAPGAQIELIEREDGVIEMRPQVAVPVSQLWFWSPQWQAREREAEADITQGRTTRFEDAESLLEALPD